MPIDIHELCLRLRDSRAQSLTIFAGGSIRVTHRDSTLEFPDQSALDAWIQTGVLPNGVSTKFRAHDPHIPQ